jgi:sugar lactone lactonase YvrE
MNAIQLATPERDLLGEAPLYDAVNGRLLWVDTFGQRVHELVSRGPESWDYGRTWTMSNVTTAAIPRAGGGFLAAVGHELLAVPERDGATTTFASLHREDALIADARCDAHGRLFALWANEDRRSPGGLLRLESDLRFTPLLSDLALPNGLDWSPDQTTLYLGDSIARCIYALAYDPATGETGDRRAIIHIERGAGTCNGFAVDNDGCLWVAMTYAGEVRRYSAVGELLETIRTPALRPTSCAFGGPDGADLFITSSAFTPPDHVLERVGISRERVERTDGEEFAGALFVCRPGSRGPAATPLSG